MSELSYQCLCGHSEQHGKEVRPGNGTKAQYWQHYDCPACGSRNGLTAQSQYDSKMFLRCGDKWSMSPWEEIKHRERN